ncbi:glycoside hydrolase family 3 protein [Zopfia rhizophila CBS 207.26]|uniref:Glycoside hydrolase family 3 protein n=1 Tax=Zopfia rhizophila CBS 207.26 TaxID=1314779 RepID=A0A6A6EDM1_9PEZI|nr:glycoside hydrolase family 3 protein [Zopfia rhizophila CBS 207.26]
MLTKIPRPINLDKTIHLCTPTHHHRCTQKGTGSKPFGKASDIVSQPTLLWKANLTTGVGFASGRCLGNTGSIPCLFFPGLCL